MKYMMLIYFDEKQGPNQAEREQCYLESAEFGQELHKRGQFVDAAPLQPTTTATSVRVREGKRTVTDGPFAETREQLGGYFVIQAGNLDEAIEVAAQIPAGKWGTVEIRPMIEVPTLPKV